MWKVENKMIATVIESWELTVSKGLEKNLRKAGTTVSVENFKQLHSTAGILRKVLDSE